MSKQIYEEYWDLTLAWTDFNGEKFLTALKTIVDFIDEEKPAEYSTAYYNKLQSILKTKLNVNNLASVRKGINQCIKLGFIEYNLLLYPTLTKDYLKAITKEERKILFSQIVYSNSSFKRSVTEDSDIREINFVVKSIQEMGELPASLIPALLSTKITAYPQGFITKQELKAKARSYEVKAFAARKYNQVDYLKILLKKLDGIVYNSSTKTYTLGQESEQVEIAKTKDCSGRDPYLQRLYKRKLQQESLQNFGAIKCMVEQLSYPTMIASHIKPFRSCDDTEAFDSNNGLLLSKNVDALFDKYYISFDEEGKIIFYNRVPEDIKEAWKDYKIVPAFMNEFRKEYLKIHQELCKSYN